MTTKKMVAILGTCLLLISSCSTNIPVSNEQISKDIIASKSKFTGDQKDYASLGGNLEAYMAMSIDFSQGSHCFNITDDNMTLFVKESGTVWLNLYHTDGYGMVKLDYDKKDDKWVFKELSIVNTPKKFKLTKGAERSNDSLAKPFCDNFDSSKVKSK
jgi:hypothetical protein